MSLMMMMSRFHGVQELIILGIWAQRIAGLRPRLGTWRPMMPMVMTMCPLAGPTFDNKKQDNGSQETDAHCPRQHAMERIENELFR